MKVAGTFCSPGPPMRARRKEASSALQESEERKGQRAERQEVREAEAMSAGRECKNTGMPAAMNNAAVSACHVLVVVCPA